MTQNKWISFRDASLLAEKLTGIRMTATQRWPTLESLLWHAAQGEIAATGRRWERSDSKGRMIAVEDGECEEEASIWKCIMLTMIYKKQSGKDLDNVNFEHFDTLTGSFEFQAYPRDRRENEPHVVHRVVGMQFDQDDIYKVFGQVSEESIPPHSKADPAIGRSDALKATEVMPRRLADPWPAWVAELAHHIHTKGYPDGSGSQGQGDLIKAVADALAERGIESLSRTTVQPVIQAVLDRLRAADD